MLSSSTRPRIIGAHLCWPVLLAVLLFSGCSALRLAYNQASTLAYWTLDGYVDFDDAQEAQVRAALDRWFQWHRANELPLYADMLMRGEAQALEPATAAQACRWYDEILLRVDAATEQLVPPAAALARTITPTQIANIERRYDKKNREFAAEYLADKPGDRLKAAVKTARERIETLYGDLDPAQERRLADSLAHSPFDAQLWLNEKRQRQQELLALLRRLQTDTVAPDALQADVRTVLRHARQSPNAAYRTYLTRLNEFNCGLSAQMHNAMTVDQRREAARRIRGWLQDLRALQAPR